MEDGTRTDAVRPRPDTAGHRRPGRLRPPGTWGWPWTAGRAGTSASTRRSAPVGSSSTSWAAGGVGGWVPWPRSPPRWRAPTEASAPFGQLSLHPFCLRMIIGMRAAGIRVPPWSEVSLPSDVTDPARAAATPFPTDPSPVHPAHHAARRLASPTPKVQRHERSRSRFRV